MNAIALAGVTKVFSGHAAVSDLDLSIPVGSLFGFLGPNGSGKTTTIRMILKILVPDSGSIHVMGKDLDDALKLRLGYLPEERGLYRGMRVDEHLVFLGALHGMDRSDARRKAIEWLARFEAEDWTGRKIQELSKGMQQKVQFIGTILHDPEIVILDEPFSGLDPVNARLLKDVMVDLHNRGRTIIYSTHQMDQVEKTCDRICLIHRGKVVVQGELAKIRQEHGKNTVQLEYTGRLPREIIDTIAEAVDDHGQYAEIRLRNASDADALLRAVIPSVSVRRFEVAEASLNDIFIRLVEADR